MKFQTAAPYWWRCYEWCRTHSRFVGDCSWVDYKVVVGEGEGKKGWLGRFKDVFRYRFGRFILEDRLFNLIPRGER